MNPKARVFSIKFFIIISAALFLSGCVSSKNASSAPVVLSDSDYIPDEFLWEPVAEGIERFDFKKPDIPLIYHIVKIDLNNEKLQLVCFPDETTKHSASGKFTGMKTLDFAKNTACIVAVNASPFDGRFFKKKIVGIHSFNKTEFSTANKKYAAIGFSNDQNNDGYCATIIQNQTDGCSADFDFCFGGFFVVLKDGKVQDSFAPNYDSRNGAGISKDGKTLYLLVVEGENKNQSIGLTYPLCGQIFCAAGCYDALEFDGGGSAQLCINGQSVLNYKTSRVQANSFGFIEK